METFPIRYMLVTRVHCIYIYIYTYVINVYMLYIYIIIIYTVRTLLINSNEYVYPNWVPQLQAGLPSSNSKLVYHHLLYPGIVHVKICVNQIRYKSQNWGPQKRESSRGHFCSHGFIFAIRLHNLSTCYCSPCSCFDTAWFGTAAAHDQSHGSHTGHARSQTPGTSRGGVPGCGRGGGPQVTNGTVLASKLGCLS